MSDPNRYAYHDGLATLSAWSDRRAQSSAAIAEWIAQTAGRRPVDLLDVGTGDGELLAFALDRVKDRIHVRRVELVEPDGELRDAAVDRLRSLGLPADAIRTSNSIEDASGYGFSHALAAHVLYYLLPAADSLAAICARLGDGGQLGLVIRSEECDTYRLRQIVRFHQGTEARLSVQSVSEDLLSIGFDEIAVSSVGATLQTPDNVTVLPPGSDTITNDEAFDYVVRWMTRLPESGPIESPIRESLRAFVRKRASSNGVELHLEDRVITASRA